MISRLDMDASTTSIEVSITRIRKRYRTQLEEAPEAPTAWELLEGVLCWHVMLRDVLEPDIDLELLEDALLVRALVGGSLHHALLPIPRPYRFAPSQVRLRSSRLEIHLNG